MRKEKRPLPHVTVVAAAIQNRGRYLLGKRPEGSLLGGLWEFPGGKVEAGETHAAALERELREELGIVAAVREPIATVNHAYSHYRVSLHLYACDVVEGKPRCLYHSDLKWVLRSHLRRYAFPKANLYFLDKL